MVVFFQNASPGGDIKIYDLNQNKFIFTLL